MKLSTSLLTALLAGAAAVLPVHAQSEADVLRCLDVGDSTARLACFDQNAQALRAARASGKAAPAAPAAPVAAAAPQDDAPRAENFGKTGRRAPEAMSSQIVGDFSEWQRNTSVKLSNGQVWQVTEESPGNSGRPLKDPKVTIKSGFLGATYYMSVEGLAFQIKVRRVQ
ncbi:hypothetical protein ACNI65_21520 [Roseateles sp. So40a]|uniref:hypothetical protein n=1 Tax=Roseateles sp. So40a TaxID=3400226 RepID=UPI003A836093